MLQIESIIFEEDERDLDYLSDVFVEFEELRFNAPDTNAHLHSAERM